MIDPRRADPPQGPLNVLPKAGARVSAPKGGEFSLAEVNVQERETLEGALWRFKRNVQQGNISNEIKRLSFHLRESHERSAGAQPEAKN